MSKLSEQITVMLKAAGVPVTCVMLDMWRSDADALEAELAVAKVNAERYVALRNAAMYDRVCDAWDFELNRMPDSAKLDDLADALIAAATTAPTVETAPGVTP